jgi:hypothetical protein
MPSGEEIQSAVSIHVVQQHVANLIRRRFSW